MEQQQQDGSGSASANEQLLTFIVDGEEYGVDILRVQEIRSWSTPMPIPNTPRYIKGVINIRGDVVAIADLRERLGLPKLEYGATTVVVVLRVRVNQGGHERVMGVIVDAMSDVTNVPQAAIKPPPSFKNSHESSLAKGIVTLENKMITILDVDLIFDVSNASLVRQLKDLGSNIDRLGVCRGKYQDQEQGCEKSSARE